VFEPPYVVAQDTAANQAVVPMQLFISTIFNPFEAPSFDVYDLTKKTRSVFSPNLGSGSVMGAAIDPAREPAAAQSRSTNSTTCS
jgi:hypothetical protein